MRKTGAPITLAALKKPKFEASSQSNVQSSKGVKPSSTMSTFSQSKPLSWSAKKTKAFHCLLAAASYFSVLESNAIAGVKMKDKCSMLYNGFDEDHPGYPNQFLSGSGPFGILWDDNQIIPGLGYISGVTKAICKAVPMTCETYSKKKL